MSPAAIHVRRARNAAVTASVLATIAAIALVAPGSARAAEPAPIVNLPIVNGVTSQLLPGVVNPVLDTVGEVVAPLPIVGAPLAGTTDQLQGGVNEVVAPVIEGVTATTTPIVGAAPAAPSAPAARPATPVPSPARPTAPVAAPEADAASMFAHGQIVLASGTFDVAPAAIGRGPASLTDGGAPRVQNPASNASSTPAQGGPVARGNSTFAVVPNDRDVRRSDEQPGDDQSTRDRVATPSSSPVPVPAASWDESIMPVIAWSSCSTSTTRPRGPPLLEIPVRPD